MVINVDHHTGGEELETPSGEVEIESFDSPSDIVLDVKATKKKRKISKVWDHFDEVPQQNEDGSPKKYNDGSVICRAICKICNSSLVSGGTNGTKHLKRHMDMCIKRSHSSGDQTVIGRGADGMIYTFQFSQERARRATVRYFVREEIPFNKVGKPAFLSWIRDAFGPQFRPSCRVTMRNDVVHMFNEEKAVLKDLFRKIPGKICFTSDMWTSIQKFGYLCITAHYIDNEWKLHKRIISFVMLPSPHTGKTVGSAIYNNLLGWNICDKVGTITLDNASNNDTAVSRLKDSCFGADAMSRDLFQIRCNAHVTNLLVQDGLNHIKFALESIRESIVHVKSSQGRLQKFFECCKNLGMAERRLPLDVSTRWDSTYYMLEASIPYKQVFENFFYESDFLYVPTPCDWNNAIIIRDYFKVFKDSTKLFSGTKYVTSSTFCYQLSMIACIMKQYSVVPSFKATYDSMKLKYDKYWKDVPLSLGLASIMDPRYKLTILDLCLDLNYEIENNAHEIEEQGKTVISPSPSQVKLAYYKAKLFELFDDYQKMCSNNVVGQNNLRPNSTSGADMVFSLLAKRRESSIQTSRSELERYLDQPLVIVTEEQSFNILDWWACQETSYPVLSKMARDLLTIPVSTVASESAFSGSSRVVTKYRSNLLPETVEALVCLKDWIQANEQLQDEDLHEIEDLMTDMNM